MNPPTAPPPAGNRILIIDDNPSIHDDLRKILAAPKRRLDDLDAAEAEIFGVPTALKPSTAFEMDSAYQGMEGRDCVEAAFREGRPYALAFVDVRMPPGWDGIETVSRLWQLDPDLQVVICTAYSDYSWDDMVRALGESDNLLILKKPFDNIEARQIAHALSKKWVLHRQVRARLNEMDEVVRQRTRDLEAANAQLRQSQNKSF